MTSATDIITYIGVPLAVLGVLPILYTFALAILTQRRIRASLVRHGHKPLTSSRHQDGFTIRSSPMTSLIEVELPRYTIAPLERGHEDYWKTTDQGQDLEEHHKLLERSVTTVSMIEEGRVDGYMRGGAWRAFHWKKLLVGRKLYRIQYEDELREPPAEMDFSELVHFLLDWGAVPDSMGWEKLKSGGLWTPAGTVLLRKEERETVLKRKHIDWVLRTSMPDESDGVLSLTIKWSKELESVATTRGAASLPPGWGRLYQPPLLEVREKLKEERVDLPARVEQMKSANKHSFDSTSLRFRAEDGKVSKVLWETDNIETGFIAEPFRTHELSARCFWFTCSSSALLSRRQPGGGLWNFDLPSDIASFVQKDTVPCGLMVILGLLADADAPQWSSERAPAFNNDASVHHQRFMARRAAEQLEATMSSEQARVHKMNREALERQNVVNDMSRKARERQEREELRVMDAIASPKMNNTAIAEACLAWLIEQGEVGREWTVEQLGEAVLYLLIVDQREDGEAKKVIEVLEEWRGWAAAGGMKKQQVNMIGNMKLEFCFAASLVAVIREGSLTSTGKAGADMLECLRTWRKVRLG